MCMNQLRNVSLGLLFSSLLLPAFGCGDLLRAAIAPEATAAPEQAPTKRQEAPTLAPPPASAAPAPEPVASAPAEEAPAPEPKPEPTKIVFDEKKLTVFGDRVVRMMERIGQDAKASKGDCTKLGKSLAAHQVEDVRNATALKAFDAGKSFEQKDAEREFLDKKFKTRMDAARQSLSSMRDCKDDPVVKKYANEVFGHN
jgi:hypothetical protein